ncbi:hypothetical protein, partial [Candidatus Magnetobacterium casense]|uniref:hypothetical protein n=1 Tax=Candidatus Magnetobacterium casense TaxID=1455061 RepID=UPI001C48F4F9
YDCTLGVAPTWAAGTGWTFNGTTQYLITGLVGLYTYSMIVQFSGVTNTGIVAGAQSVDGRFWIRPNTGVGNVTYACGVNTRDTAPNLASGNLAFASYNCYRNGVADGAIAAGATSTTHVTWIGCRNLINVYNLGYAGNIQALAIYNTALTAPQILAVYTAMVAL